MDPRFGRLLGSRLGPEDQPDVVMLGFPSDECSRRPWPAVMSPSSSVTAAWCGATTWRPERIAQLYRSSDSPTLVSFDLDAVSEAEAPGVSAPNAAGLSSDLWLDAAYQAGRSPAVSSADVVELNPTVDRDGQTATAGGCDGVVAAAWQVRAALGRVLARHAAAMHCRDNSKRIPQQSLEAPWHLRVCGTSMSFLLLGAQLAAGQARQITGRVTNAHDRGGACRGNDRGQRHRNRGRDQQLTGTMSSMRPDGDVRPSWSAPSATSTNRSPFRHRKPTANVALEPDVFKLEEIVITGQATGVERQNLPNAVATVSAERAEPGAGPDARERAAGQDSGRLHPGQLRRAGRRLSAQPAGRVHHQRQCRSALCGGWHRGQQRGDSQRTERGQLRPVRRQPTEPGQSGQPDRRP